MDKCTLVGSKCAETFGDENIVRSETEEEGDVDLDSLSPQKEAKRFESNKSVSLSAPGDVIVDDDRERLTECVSEVVENTQPFQTFSSLDIVSSETSISEPDGCDMKEFDISKMDQIYSKEADVTADNETPVKDSSHLSLTSSTSSSLLPQSTKNAETTSNELDELRKLCVHLQSVLDQQLKERERMQQKNEDLSHQMKSLKEVPCPQQQSCSSKEVPEAFAKIQVSETNILRKELEVTKMILETQGSKFNKEMSSLTSSYNSKLENLSRSYEECKKEKESMVIRYAQAESRNIELQESWKRAEQKMKEFTKEKDSALAKWNSARTENSRLLKLLDAKDNELASLKRDCESQREANNSKDLQMKYLHQKIRQEQDVTKEARERVQEMLVQTASERVDRECLMYELKAILQANQMLQLTGSLPTFSQVMSRIELVISKKKEESQPKELWTDIFESLSSLVNFMSGLMTDSVAHKEKVKRLNQDLKSSEETLSATRRRTEECEKEKEEVRLQMAALQSKLNSLQEEMEGLKDSKEKSSELDQMNEELRAEMEVQSKRYSECLEYADKLSHVYASLQAENIRLVAEVDSKNEEKEKLSSKCKDLEVENKQLIEQRMVGLRDFEEKVVVLERQLEQTTTEYDLLRIQYNDVEDELKSLKRQSGARIKDLTRQLHKLSKNPRLDSTAPEYDSSGSSNFSDNGLLSTSATPSHTTRSNETAEPDETRNNFVGNPTKKISFGDEPGLRRPIGTFNDREGGVGDRPSSNRTSVHDDVGVQNKKYQMQDHEVMCDDNCEVKEVGYMAPPTVRVVEVNKQMLVDKIVSLQKILAKKNERMDFLQELNSRLSHDVSSKAKIIQNYILREEAGVMSTNQSDRLKLQMSKRGGIMASLFSSQPQDEAMTVDLALEISHKLQSVLEDTLLKNIALKDSIELLGQQVAKLSKENENLSSRPSS